MFRLPPHEYLSVNAGPVGPESVRGGLWLEQPGAGRGSLSVWLRVFSSVSSAEHRQPFSFKEGALCLLDRPGADLQEGGSIGLSSPHSRCSRKTSVIPPQEPFTFTRRSNSSS